MLRFVKEKALRVVANDLAPKRNVLSKTLPSRGHELRIALYIMNAYTRRSDCGIILIEERFLSI